MAQIKVSFVGLFLVLSVNASAAVEKWVSGSMDTQYDLRCGSDYQAAIQVAREDAVSQASIACGARADRSTEWETTQLACSSVNDSDSQVKVTVQAGFLCHKPGRQVDARGSLDAALYISDKKAGAEDAARSHAKSQCGSDVVQVSEWKFSGVTPQGSGVLTALATFECLKD